MEGQEIAFALCLEVEAESAADWAGQSFGDSLRRL